MVQWASDVSNFKQNIKDDDKDAPATGLMKFSNFINYEISYFHNLASGIRPEDDFDADFSSAVF